MYQIRQTKVFRDWFLGLKDKATRKRIDIRLDRAGKGNLGDWKAIGNGLSEMRIDHGGGYRLYFTIMDREIVFLLVGGKKKSQKKDIEKALEMLRQLREK